MTSRAASQAMVNTARVTIPPCGSRRSGFGKGSPVRARPGRRTDRRLPFSKWRALRGADELRREGLSAAAAAGALRSPIASPVDAVAPLASERDKPVIPNAGTTVLLRRRLLFFKARFDMARRSPFGRY